MYYSGIYYRISHLPVPVHDVTHVKIILVLAEGVERGLRNLEQAHVHAELENDEDWGQGAVAAAAIALSQTKLP